jgi:hypothetical protein
MQGLIEAWLAEKLADSHLVTFDEGGRTLEELRAAVLATSIVRTRGAQALTNPARSLTHGLFRFVRECQASTSRSACSLQVCHLSSLVTSTATPTSHKVRKLPRRPTRNRSNLLRGRLEKVPNLNCRRGAFSHR